MGEKPRWLKYSVLGHFDVNKGTFFFGMLSSNTMFPFIVCLSSFLFWFFTFKGADVKVFPYYTITHLLVTTLHKMSSICFLNNECTYL